LYTNFSTFDLVVWLSLFLAIITTIIVACFGTTQRFYESKKWRITLGILVAITLLLIPVAFRRSISDERDRQVALRYTFHPTTATTFDGINFPAGSTVIEDTQEPHHVTSGNVPNGTNLLGLTINGDFSIQRSTPSSAPELDAAFLTAPGTIHDVPCGPGSFKLAPENMVTSMIDTLSCTLAADYAINGLVLKSDTYAQIAIDHSSMSGTLAAPWKTPFAECAAGEFSFTPTLLECTLHRNTVIDGYPLAADQKAAIVTDEKGEISLYSGTLSRNFDVSGISIPAGSTLSASGQVPSADKLLSHALEHYESAEFKLPENAHLTVYDVDVRGNVDIIIFAHKIDVNRSTFSGDDTKGTSVNHNGIEGHHGTYDLTTHTWCWEHDCWN
jgi:hypothetical protein